MNSKHMRVWAACVSCVAGVAGSVLGQAMQWRVEDGGNGHWYEFVHSASAVTWHQARDGASARGGQLVAPATATEDYWVRDNIFVPNYAGDGSESGPFIGGTSEGRGDGDWYWVTGEPWGFGGWAPGEPGNCCGESYVQFTGPPWTSYGWNDTNENSNGSCHSFIVEYSADCNGDGIVDFGQILSGQVSDTNHNGIPDVCENLCHTAAWTTMGNQAFGTRWFQSQAYSGANSGTLLFGGSTVGTNTLGDTWLNTGSTWTQVATTGPAARNESAMCELGNGHVLLFGGVASPTNPFTALADTWDWNGTAWTRINVAAPTARMGHRMAYDSIRNRVVMFGGLDYHTELRGDTWEWDGVAWTQVATTGPLPRFAHSLAFDPIRGKTVLYGGHNVVDLGDTWEWNGTTWTQMAVAGPAGRSYPASAYYPVLGGVVVTGGSVSGVITNETLLWNGTTWQTVQLAEGISPRWVHTMSFDAAENRLVVAGGSPGGTARYSDAWELSTAISIGTQPQPMSGYIGTSVSFNVIGRGPVSGYQWRKGGVILTNGGRVSGATSATLSISNLQQSDAAMYDCIVSSDCRSVTSNSALLTVMVCPADFNHDGSLDFFDYLDFVDAYSIGLPSADFNNDLNIDFFDYLDFVDAYSIGC